MNTQARDVAISVLECERHQQINDQARVRSYVESAELELLRHHDSLDEIGRTIAAIDVALDMLRAVEPAEEAA